MKMLFLAWCRSTCPGFCEVMNDTYQCNCLRYPGFEYSDDGKSCVGKIHDLSFESSVVLMLCIAL